LHGDKVSGTADTDRLIATLRGDLAARRPLRPPLLRALLWLLLIGVPVAFAVLRLANLHAYAVRSAETRVALEGVGALLTGITAIIAAFYLSLPDRSSLWRYAPLPPLLLWLGASGLGCLHNGLGLGPAGERLGESSSCFRFIVVASVPLALLLFAALRRARPLAPLPVALCGALGVAALVAFVLQFFHPFDVTIIDLAMHALGVLVVIGAAALFRRGALASR
jgi:hypothetical protein